MAEACANRTHPGRSSRPTTVLKTAGPTRNHPPPSVCGIVPTPVGRVKLGRGPVRHGVAPNHPDMLRGTREREPTHGNTRRERERLGDVARVQTETREDTGEAAWGQGGAVDSRTGGARRGPLLSRRARHRPVHLLPDLPRDDPVLRRVACRPARQDRRVHRLSRGRRASGAVRPQVRGTRRGEVARTRGHVVPSRAAAERPQQALHSLPQDAP